jgi:hypothetical protein
MADTTIGSAVIDIKFNLGDLNKQLNQALSGIGNNSSILGQVIGTSIGVSIGSKIGSSFVSKSVEHGTEYGIKFTNAFLSIFGGNYLSRMQKLKGNMFGTQTSGMRTLEKEFPLITKTIRGITDLSSVAGMAKTIFSEWGVAITAVTAAMTGFVMAWAKDETAILRMPILFRNATKEAEKFFDTLASRTGLSSDDIREVGNGVQSMLVPFMLDRGKAEKQMEELTARIFDVSAASGVAASEVGVIFESILQGNMRSARRLDILMSDTLVDSVALTMSHKASKEQLTEQEKALARIKMLMEQTNDRSGAFADRALSVAGAWTILWSQIKEFGSAIGRIISGIIGVPVIINLAADGLRLINELLGYIGRSTDQLGAAWKSIYAIIKTAGFMYKDFFFSSKLDIPTPLDSLKKLWETLKNIWGKKDLGKDPIEKLKDDLKQGKESAASIADDIKSINTEAQKLAGKSRFDFLAMGNQEGGVSFTTGEGQGSIGKASAKAFEDFLENSKRLLGVNEEQVKLLREVAKGNNSVFA